MISLIEGYYKQENYWTMGSEWLSWGHHNRKLYGRHNDLVVGNVISVSQMTRNMFRSS